MRIRRLSLAFHPGTESVEERVLTTTGLAGAASIHPAVATFAERRALLLEARVASQARAGAGANLIRAENIRALDTPPRIAPGLGKGLVRLNLPLNHTDYGAVSIWNNTYNRVTILVGANTHRNGQLEAYTLLPGRTQTYFAYSAINGDSPTFTLILPGQPEPYQLSKVNLLYQPYGYFAPAKVGYPYSINFGANGNYLSYI